MLLSSMQNKLASLYETPIEHYVDDFLITDATLAQTLEGSTEADTNSERVLLQQSADSLDISLYIDRSILDGLALQDPYERLDARNLNSFMIALEGVSHFNYIVWNARFARQITQLELELQAEVDKFISAVMLFDEQGRSSDLESLHDTVFAAVAFSAAANEPNGERYRCANHYAGKYCKQLTQRYPGQHHEPSFMNEVRRFYRLPQNQKIRAIDQH